MPGAVLLPEQLQRHARPLQLPVHRRPVGQRTLVLGNGRWRRIEAGLQRFVRQVIRQRPHDASPPRPPQIVDDRRRPDGEARRHLPARHAAGVSAAARRVACAWAISLQTSPDPLLKRGRGDADSQARNSGRRSCHPPRHPDHVLFADGIAILYLDLGSSVLDIGARLDPHATEFRLRRAPPAKLLPPRV